MPENDVVFKNKNFRNNKNQGFTNNNRTKTRYGLSHINRNYSNNGFSRNEKNHTNYNKIFGFSPNDKNISNTSNTGYYTYGYNGNPNPYDHGVYTPLNPYVHLFPQQPIQPFLGHIN